MVSSMRSLSRRSATTSDDRCSHEGQQAIGVPQRAGPAGPAAQSSRWLRPGPGTYLLGLARVSSSSAGVITKSGVGRTGALEAGGQAGVWMAGATKATGTGTLDCPWVLEVSTNWANDILNPSTSIISRLFSSCSAWISLMASD